MPGLKWCGRRWAIGTDDFVFPGLADLFIRIPWILIVSVIYTQHIQPSPCLQSIPLEIYIIGSLALLSAITLLSTLLVSQSMRGTVMEGKSRRLVPYLLTVRLLLSFLELVLNVLGSYCVFSVFDGCDQAVNIGLVVTGLVAFNWLILFMTVFWIYVVFDPCSESITPGDVGITSSLTESDLWETRCQRALCWKLRHDREKVVFKEVAGVLRMLFSGQDLVPSDVAAGLILLNHHRKSESECTGTMAEGSRNLSTLPSPCQSGSAWMNIETASHFIRFAFGSYGWPWFFYSNFWTGFCKVCSELRCCAYRRKLFSPVGDNCCLCHYASLKRITGLSEDDIRYVSFHNSVYEVPFFVSVDHSSCNVVVAIRGTLSIHDLLTDMSARTEDLRLCSRLGEREECWVAHKGMTYAATYVRNCLLDNQILEQTFHTYPDYGLMIVGHSLGGGTAAILALMLKEDYPDVRCIAYSPPGLLCRESSSFCADFVLSVVIGDDLIPRMSLASLQSLKYDLCEELERCRLPKYKILIDGCWKAVFGYPRNTFTETGASPTIPLLKDEEPCHLTSKPERAVDPDSVSFLFVPGCVLHILPSPDGSKSYYSKWEKPDSFSNIIVSPRMLADHLPDQVLKILTSMSSS